MRSGTRRVLDVAYWSVRTSCGVLLIAGTLTIVAGWWAYNRAYPEAT